MHYREPARSPRVRVALGLVGCCAHRYLLAHGLRCLHRWSRSQAPERGGRPGLVLALAAAVTADPRYLADHAPGDNKIMVPAVQTRGRSPGCTLPRLGRHLCGVSSFPGHGAGMCWRFALGVEKRPRLAGRHDAAGLAEPPAGADVVGAAPARTRPLPAQTRPATGRAFGPARAIR
jgi:hypothetical protein